MDDPLARFIITLDQQEDDDLTGELTAEFNLADPEDEIDMLEYAIELLTGALQDKRKEHGVTLQ